MTATRLITLERIATIVMVSMLKRWENFHTLAMNATQSNLEP